MFISPLNYIVSLSASRLNAGESLYPLRRQ